MFISNKFITKYFSSFILGVENFLHPHPHIYATSRVCINRCRSRFYFWPFVFESFSKLSETEYLFFYEKNVLYYFLTTINVE